MRLLALDIGSKRIGMAICEAQGLGIWPEKTLIRTHLKADLEKIRSKIEEYDIQTLVLGLPLHMDGAEGSQAKKVKTFAQALQDLLSQAGRAVSMEWVDERLTSWEAEQLLTERGLKGAKRKQNTDAVAACLILEDYLSRQSREG